MKELEKVNFNKISNYILNNCLLSINKDQYRITEIEFYLKNEEHNDVYTHCNSLQLDNSTWYFHRKSDKGNYSGGTFKGLDITFGDKESYGGILIRSIMSIKTNELIQGPCKCVNKILELTSMSSINELVLNSKTLNIYKSSLLSIIETKDLMKEIIYKSPRVGLTLKSAKNIEIKIDYIAKLYRYCIYPTKYNSKIRNYIICGLLMCKQDVYKVFSKNINKKLIEKKIKLYNEGIELDIEFLEPYIFKTWKVNDIYKCMGILYNYI